MTEWHKVTSMREWMEALDLPVISRCVGMRLPFSLRSYGCLNKEMPV